VIVRDVGDAWQVVLQTDHADLAAGFARAWADRGPRHDSLALATERHDDGWAVWEASPQVDDAGKPVSFLEVDVTAHLAFYRACIAAVTDEDPYAGLLVSMHGAGIYRQRYGSDPALKLTRADDVQELVDEFVAEQETSHAARAEAIGVDDERRWADYRLLQVYDRLALHFCMRDVASTETELEGYRLEPVGEWGVRVDPYPFVEEVTHLRLLRRLVPKRAWAQDEFRHGLGALAPEAVDLAVTRA
jgi:uncharacterized protein DUF3891